MDFPEDLRNQIKAHIADRCGLYFRDHDLKNLEAGVKERMRVCGLDSPHAYYLHLTTSGGKEAEFRELLNLLTINHTYFFRNEPQFLAFKDQVIPELMARKRQQAGESHGGKKLTLRFWSAGCSTGEEAYTIAMILKELIPPHEDWEIEIFATDASTEALEKAQRGVYGENSMRLVEEPYRSKYFTRIASPRQNAEWKIAEEIKRMVRFSFLNLVADPYPAGLDVIFCRNVTIYFELATTVKIMNDFFESLQDPGYLFLGYSESLQFISDKYTMVCWQDAICYRKATGKKGEAAPALSWKIPEEEEGEIAETPPLPSLKSLIETEALQPVMLTAGEFEAVRKQIVRFIYLKEYAKALAVINKISIEEDKKVDIHYLAADIYANMNRHQEAKARLKALLAIDPLFAPAYYLLGCIYLEEDQNGPAKENLQKALFIDKNFVMARFYMAHMLREEGRVKDAIREYRNTLSILSKGLSGPKSEMILQSSGFNGATLKSICCDNLERLKIEQ